MDPTAALLAVAPVLLGSLLGAALLFGSYIAGQRLVRRAEELAAEVRQSVPAQIRAEWTEVQETLEHLVDRNETIRRKTQGAADRMAQMQAREAQAEAENVEQLPPEQQRAAILRRARGR